MKRLIEISERTKGIEVEMKEANAEALLTLEAELDMLILEKKDLEKKQLELRAKFDSAVVVESEVATPENRAVENEFDTLEYRNDFMQFVLNGTGHIATRATTNTTDVGALIPTTILNKVIEKMEHFGKIYPLITKTSYKGGVEIPVSDVKPVATWVAEGTVAPKQKKVVGSITFGYHKLQIRVAITLVASATSLAIFEKKLADNMAEAFVMAIEEAVINGTGTGQPLGITVDPRVPAGQVVDFNVAEATYDGWLANLFSKIPTAYREKRGVIILNTATFDKYIVGLTDTTGQPIIKTATDANGKILYRLFGKPVILFDGIASLETAGLSTVVGLYANFSDYFLNSNLAITMRKYFNENTDEEMMKSTFILDGKLADPNSVVILKTRAI